MTQTSNNIPLPNINDMNKPIEEKVISPSIKPHDFAAIPLVLHEPLLKENEEVQELPVITYGYDTPTNFVSFTKEDNEIDIETARRRGLEELSKIKVETQIENVSDVPLVICSGSYYASEKILDTEFMKNISAQLGSDLLAVSIPRKGIMMVTDGAPPNTKAIQAFMMITLLKYSENEDSTPLSDKVFIVQDGELCGVIQTALKNKMEEGETEKSPVLSDMKSPKQTTTTLGSNNEHVIKGSKKTLKIMIVLLVCSIAISIITNFVFKPFDSTSVMVNILRLGLHAGLFYAIFQGKIWTKHITSILYIFSIIGSIIVIIGVFVLGFTTALALLPFVLFQAYALYFFNADKDFIAFFEHQKRNN